MAEFSASQLAECREKINKVFGIEDPAEKAEAIRAYLAESERRRPEWLKERYRQMDEALRPKQADEIGPLAGVALGGMAALGGLVAADKGVFGDGAKEFVQPVAKPLKKVINWDKGRASTMKFPNKRDD